MHRTLNYLLLVTAFCVGCSTLIPVAHAKVGCDEKTTEFDTRHYLLHIGKSGDLLDPASGEEVKHIDNSRDQKESEDKEGAYISSIFKNFEKQKVCKPELQLTIYVHGGLNTLKKVTSHANKKVIDDMLADNKYPLFISWNSGGPSNYSDHLFLLRRGIMAYDIGPISSPFVLLEDVARSGARLPASIYYMFANQNSDNQEDYGRKIYYWRAREAREANRTLCQLKEDNFKFKFNIHDARSDNIRPVSEWLSILNPFRLVTAPFMDVFGTGAWRSMLRRTDMVLEKDPSARGILNPEGFREEKKLWEERESNKTAVSKFLSRWQDPNENKHSSSEVILIGHSMGTIIANNIVSRHQDINFSRIVYMAAATTLKDIKYVITPYLRKNKEAEFYNLTLNPRRDIMESNAFDFVPRGSLLMWIDQTLADVNSFQDRTAGYWYNIVRGADLIFDNNDQFRGRVHLTKFGIDDGSPQNHGEFDDYSSDPSDPSFPFWKQSFWKGEPNKYPISEKIDKKNCEIILNDDKKYDAGTEARMPR